jgi:hypothetical protein
MLMSSGYTAIIDFDKVVLGSKLWRGDHKPKREYETNENRRNKRKVALFPLFRLFPFVSYSLSEDCYGLAVEVVDARRLIPRLSSIFTSTRRFCARPAAVLLLATASVLP